LLTPKIRSMSAPKGRNMPAPKGRRMPTPKGKTMPTPRTAASRQLQRGACQQTRQENANNQDCFSSFYYSKNLCFSRSALAFACILVHVYHINSHIYSYTPSRMFTTCLHCVNIKGKVNTLWEHLAKNR
jgi:hypothetical protein